MGLGELGPFGRFYLVTIGAYTIRAATYQEIHAKEGCRIS
jgi:hypothetical protein